MGARTAARVSAAQKREMALALATTGASYKQIADQLGVSKTRAHQYVHEELAKLADLSTGHARLYRQRQLERINRLLLGVWQSATKGNLQAVDRAVKLMERESRLLGLDSPEKIAPTTPDGTAPYDPHAMSPAERAARIAELERKRRDAEPA